MSETMFKTINKQEINKVKLTASRLKPVLTLQYSIFIQEERRTDIGNILQFRATY